MHLVSLSSPPFTSSLQDADIIQNELNNKSEQKESVVTFSGLSGHPGGALKAFPLGLLVTRVWPM